LEVPEVAVNRPFTSSEEDRELIGSFSRALDRHPEMSAQITLDGRVGETLTVPSPIFEALKKVAEFMAMGRAVSILPTGTMMTTQQAADFLSASRPHVIGLLEKNEIPYEKVGTHRRIRIEDLIAYKQRRAAARDKALRRLSEQAERLELDY
jgi:excisionase family DNA binding protein